MTWRSLTLILALSPLTLTGCPPDNPDDTGDTDTSDTDTTDPGTDTDTDTDTPAGIDCHVVPSILPEWAGDIEPPSLATTVPYTLDAGLDDVMAAMPAVGESVTVDIDVTGAYVTTLGFNPGVDAGEVHSFYIGDVSGGIYVRLDFTSAPSVDVVPGDAVNFTVTEVENFNGLLQISAISDLSVVSENNEIYVKAASGQTLDTTNDISELHQLHGELVSGATGCGGSSVCFDFETRDGDTSVVSMLRVNNNNLTPPLIEGDCVQVNAPLTEFNGDAQFNIGNFAWHRWYGNVND